MELKQAWVILKANLLACFNRTFMELKHEQYRDLRQRNDCFNRTFMELKRPQIFLS